MASVSGKVSVVVGIMISLACHPGEERILPQQDLQSGCGHLVPFEDPAVYENEPRKSSLGDVNVGLVKKNPQPRALTRRLGGLSEPRPRRLDLQHKTERLLDRTSCDVIILYIKQLIAKKLKMN